MQSFEEILLKSSHKRKDGRSFNQDRSLEIDIQQPGTALVSIANSTRSLATVTAALGKPHSDRPFEGTIAYTLAVICPISLRKDQLLRAYIDKAWKDCKPIDTESLCILAGSQCWNLRVDVRVLEDGGNLIECVSAAMIAALLTFKRNDVVVVGDVVTVFDMRERVGVSLGIRHLPAAVEIGVLSDGELLVDTGLQEEEICELLLLVAINGQREICFVEKVGDSFVKIDTLSYIIQVAVCRRIELIECVKKSLSK